MSNPLQEETFVEEADEAAQEPAARDAGSRRWALIGTTAKVTEILLRPRATSTSRDLERHPRHRSSAGGSPALPGELCCHPRPRPGALRPGRARGGADPPRPGPAAAPSAAPAVLGAGSPPSARAQPGGAARPTAPRAGPEGSHAAPRGGGGGSAGGERRCQAGGARALRGCGGGSGRDWASWSERRRQYSGGGSSSSSMASSQGKNELLFADWMAALPDSLHSTPLTNLAIPGGCSRLPAPRPPCAGKAKRTARFSAPRR